MIPHTLKYRLIFPIQFFFKRYDSCFRILSKEVKQLFRQNHSDIGHFEPTYLRMGEAVAKKYCVSLSELDTNANNNLLILNSEIYDTGGHTEVAIRFTESMNDIYNIYWVVTNSHKSCSMLAPVKSEIIKRNAAGFLDLYTVPLSEKFNKILELIKEKQISCIMSNIHPDDALLASLLAVIRKHTDINIVFWNHSDHNYCAGISLAHTILTRTSKGKAINPYIEHMDNVENFYFIEKHDVAIPLYTETDVDNLRRKLHIPIDAFLTITGCNAGKILSKPDEPYLNLVKRILENNPSFYHILIGITNPSHKKIIEQIIGETLINNRFIILPPSPNFDLYLQTSDVLIDSFPQGSALTLLDCMRCKIPPVVKINKEEPIKSFQAYMPDDYPYSCATVEEMYNSVLELACNKEKYMATVENNYLFYRNTYNIDVIKKHYERIINDRSKIAKPTNI